MIQRLFAPVRWALCLALLAVHCLAQGNDATPKRSPLDSSSWGVVYDIPATRDVTVQADVPYLRSERGALTVDMYLPPGLKSGEKRPAVVFLNAIGDRPGDKVKNWEIYKSWPRLVAAHGLVGISMDADGERVQESIRGVFSFLAEHGAEHHVDSTRLGVYAASANVHGAAEYLLGGQAAAGIRAAALYYGNPPAERPRADLPVLFITAAGDAPRLGAPLTALWQRVVEAGAPWTLLFASRLPHAFDAFSDNDDSRRIIQQTIAFWKSHLEPVPAPPWQPSPAREIVAATYGNDSQRIADLLVPWIAAHPDDADAQLHYGRALSQLRRSDEAAAAFERALKLGSNHPGVYAGLAQIKLSKQQWQEAAQLLSKAIENGARNSLNYGQLAFAQLHFGRNEEAVKNYEQAFALGIPPGVNTRGLASYNLACGYARLGQKDKAFEALAQAVNEGFGTRDTYDGDEDFAPLRADPRYQQIVEKLPKSRP